MNHQRTNFILRTLVWLGFLSWCVYVRKPAGSSLVPSRLGVGVVVGVVLALAGLALYVWAARTLASEVPSTLAAPAMLLRRGPYRYVRNPLYLAVGALLVGAITLYAPWGPRDLIAVGVIATFIHIFVVRREEPATRRRLGSTYDEYCADVPRWIPRLTLRAIARRNAPQR